MLATANDFGMAVVKALGLEDKLITEIHIHIISRQIVTVDVVKELLEEEGARVTRVMSSHVLANQQQVQRMRDALLSIEAMSGGDSQAKAIAREALEPPP